MPLPVCRWDSIIEVTHGQHWLKTCPGYIKLRSSWYFTHHCDLNAKNKQKKHHVWLGQVAPCSIDCISPLRDVPFSMYMQQSHLHLSQCQWPRLLFWSFPVAVIGGCCIPYCLPYIVLCSWIDLYFYAFKFMLYMKPFALLTLKSYPLNRFTGVL